MIQINNLRMAYNHTEEELLNEIEINYGIKKNNIEKYIILKKSIDARSKKRMIFFEYNLALKLKNENSKKYSKYEEKNYSVPEYGKEKIPNKPIIIGSGPAGMFTGLILAENGFNPIILERGKDIKTRSKDVKNFWNNGIFNEKSNVQFGEGGAGTFSDGKLTTLIKDKNSRIKKVLEEFCEAGAPKEILYLNKPHIGTDILKIVVENIRNKIEKLGGKYYFDSNVTDLIIKNSEIMGVIINNNEKLYSNNIILSIGHSSRDTFEMLLKNNIEIHQKPFSMGIRIEHDQDLINESQYGKFKNDSKLGAADYKLSYRTKQNRAVYTFCMCPGGYVIASQSEKNSIVTNGMSKYLRNNKNSNSAVLVNINTEDFNSVHPLAGMFMQRKIEYSSFNPNKPYFAPVQLLEDFLNNKVSKKIKNIEPSYTPGYYFKNLNENIPNFISESLKEGIINMGNKLKGFDYKYSVLTGFETRSSSPITIIRNKNLESLKGLYPAGEGAGYAGGITSSAVDGIRVAEEIIKKYKP